ncbi:MAG: hypothetical protein U1F36_23140 [Planctomycetota bacterium]
MRGADAEDYLERRTPIVFVADQRPFDLGSSRFCLLQPLMAADGRRLEDLITLFPNRGRVWWMLRDRLPEVTPGSLWTSRLQRPALDDVGPDKDHYQAAREEIEPGAKDWISIVEFDIPMPSIDEILEGRIPFHGPRPTKELLLRFTDSLVGPFRLGEVRPDGGLALSALDLGRATVRRCPAKKLDGEQRFEVQLAQYSRNFDEPPTRAVVTLVPRKTALALDGREIDASSTVQVIRWALELAGYSKAQQRPIREVLEAVPRDRVEPAHQERLQRFQTLCERILAGIDFGAEVSKALAQHDGFRPILDRHRDELVDEEVRKILGERRQQIARETEGATKELERRRQELKDAELEYDLMKADQEKRLADENASWIANLEGREAAVRVAEQELEQQQQRIVVSLGEVVSEYRDRAQEVLKQLLVFLPLLPSAAGAASTRTGPAANPSIGQGGLLPAWLGSSKQQGEVLGDERAFLQQFRDVAQRRGFAFSPNDLGAFHVAVKTGVWTVLAGASGLGKSSLPVLYAEALGQRQELLHVPVRPDWLDDRQVLGAFNPLTERFESASTGLTEHLICAGEDWRRQRGGIYLVVLDEMNLARVEHYFARFLSVLERREDERTLELFSRAQENQGDPFSRHRVLTIPPNVRFVGTVNIDESIHFFSPKVMDRCAVVSLSQGDLDAAIRPTAQARELGLPAVPWSVYASWNRAPAACPDTAVQLLTRADELLRGARSGLGYRSFARARSFVASARGVLTDETALDYAVFQYVLPRVRTLQKESQRLLAELAKTLPAEQFPRSSAAISRMLDGDEYFQIVC